MHIKQLTSLRGLESPLVALLQDVVADDASIGFLPPLTLKDAQAYWQSVEQDLQAQQRDCFVLYDGDDLLGCAQLAYCSKANGRHRGEVEKVMVHSKARGNGFGRALMAQVEAQARAQALQLLVLDTRLGDVASTLYRRMGFIEAGQIPKFARSANGALDATVFFYKDLSGEQPC